MENPRLKILKKKSNQLYRLAILTVLEETGERLMTTKSLFSLTKATVRSQSATS